MAVVSSSILYAVLTSSFLFVVVVRRNTSMVEVHRRIAITINEEPSISALLPG